MSSEGLVAEPKYTFAAHPLTEDQRAWLDEMVRASGESSPRTVRVRIRDRVSPTFSPAQIDPRLYASGRITPVGLWHVNAAHPIFDAMDKTIRAVRERIYQTPELKEVSAAEIAADTGLQEGLVAEAFYTASELWPRFFSTAHGVPGNQRAYSKLELPHDNSAEDAYLDYVGVMDLLERFYTNRGRALSKSVAYSEQIETKSGGLDGEIEYTKQGASAVYQAIRTCIQRDGRAYVGNVPREAESILMIAARGAIDTVEANRQVERAIAGLSQEGKIEAAVERHRDWRILAETKEEVVTVSSKKVFVVHGHDDGTKHEVARFIERLGLEVIILHEQVNRGRTIISKFREEAEGASFAVVLMTPDDQGKSAKTEMLQARARQNVVFELGFFIGKLGADRVAALVKGDIEKPSDFQGVLYISLEQGDWKSDLVKELKAAGLPGDWSKLFS